MNESDRIAKQARLPVGLMGPVIATMDFTRACYVVPWAMWADEDGLLWLHPDYSTTPRPGGTTREHSGDRQPAKRGAKVNETSREVADALADRAARHQVWVWEMTLSARHTTTELRMLARKEGIKVTGMRRDELKRALAEVYAAREPAQDAR